MIPDYIKRDVLDMVAQGIEYPVIAQELGLTGRSTVAGIVYRERAKASKRDLPSRPVTIRRVSWEKAR